MLTICPYWCLANVPLSPPPLSSSMCRTLCPSTRISRTFTPETSTSVSETTGTGPYAACQGPQWTCWRGRPPTTTGLSRKGQIKTIDSSHRLFPLSDLLLLSLAVNQAGCCRMWLTWAPIITWASLRTRVRVLTLQPRSPWSTAWE